MTVDLHTGPWVTADYTDGYDSSVCSYAQTGRPRGREFVRFCNWSDKTFGQGMNFRG